MASQGADDGGSKASPGKAAQVSEPGKYRLKFIEPWRRHRLTEDGKILPYPNLAKNLGLNRETIEELSTSMAPPAGYSWHHHQDVGRMQLIPLGKHKLAAPHTGGMAIWGGGQ